MDIRRRFDEDLNVLADMESILLESASDRNPGIPGMISNMYKRELDKEHLATYLKTPPDVIPQYNPSFGFVIKKVTSILTICVIVYT